MTDKRLDNKNIVVHRDFKEIFREGSAGKKNSGILVIKFAKSREILIGIRDAVKKLLRK